MSENESDNGLIFALVLDGKGSARRLSWNEISDWQAEQGVLWMHFDYTYEAAREWITNTSNLDEIAAEALLTQETRPRTTAIGDSALLALRGVNLNPGSDPEDMVSIRVWLDGHRIISTRKRKLLSASDIVSSLESNDGPRTPGEFIVTLVGGLTDRVEATIEEIEDRVDAIEDDVLTGASSALRSKLSEARREAIMLRRYLAPQREAMIKLSGEKLSWLDDDDRMRLREVTDRLIRYIEDLDSVRDRALVTQEELIGKLSEQLNNRMYVLSIVAAIFLPLGFLTGLLGINVGGIPGAESPWGFTVFIIILGAVLTLQIGVFKKMKWL